MRTLRIAGISVATVGTGALLVAVALGGDAVAATNHHPSPP